MLGINATIADEIQNLTKINAKLQRSLSKLGTTSDGRKFRDTLGNEMREAKRLCSRLMELFKQNTSNSDQRVLEKLKDQFRRELKKYSTVSEQIQKKEREAVVSMREESTSRRSRTDGQSAHGFYQQLQDDPEFEFHEVDVEDIQRRQEGIRQIEQDVVDVHEMFNDLQGIVNEQQDFIDTIEGNITGAKNKTAAAHEELVQAEKLQKSGRKKTCCILLILVIVIAVVVLLSQVL